MKRLGILMIAALAAACAGLYGGGTRQGVSSSLVDYLYPKGEVPPRQEGVIPHLQIPLAVGLAFVPSQSPAGNVLPEAERMRLLNDVKSAFAGRDYIREIAVIPDAYMRSGRGFDALEQTARLYGLDVMALVSYDQVTHTSEKKSSLLYWTIVGAYFIEGNKNDVQTFVDTAVIDVATRKLLFRAPGTSEHKSDSTLVEVERDLRAGQQKGFETAMADMTVNLDKELATFRERIKTDGSVRVTRTGGAETGGGGAAGAGFLMLIAGLLLLPAGTRRR